MANSLVRGGGSAATSVAVMGLSSEHGGVKGEEQLLSSYRGRLLKVHGSLICL